MKNKLSIVILLIIWAHMLYGAEEGKNIKSSHNMNRLAGSPAQTILDINNITTWVRDDGFFDWVVEGSWNGTFPKGTIGDIFSQGIVWGGFVDDGQSPSLRVGGSTYRTGSVAGAIKTDATGNVTGREDPGASDVRIFRVRPDYKTGDLRDDAANLLQKALGAVTDDDISQLRAQYGSDWNEWPAIKGAPYDDKDGNGSYDPTVDVPGIPGADQTVYYVANDLGPNSTVYGAPPIGLEMQMTLWAYSSELFSNIQFKRVRLIYKGTSTGKSDSKITGMYITQWSDPDNGDYSDDFAGCDTALSLGYDYNSAAQDLFYRDRFGLPPPAVGFDFLQGVIVPGTATDTAIFNFKKIPGKKNLPMTTFSYFAAGSNRGDPDLGKYSGTNQWYNLMRGCEPRPEYPSCNPFKDNNGQVTRFELSGDPVAGTGDLDGRLLQPGDRRILLATGPFDMARGDTQEVVIAQVDGLGGDNLSSVAIMKSNDKFAQAAYDKLFSELPGAPPPPRVAVTELSNEIVLNWGTNDSLTGVIEDVDRQGWKFEGYNVYQMPSASARFPQDAVKITTFDLIDNIRAITNRVFDPVAKIPLDVVRQIGSDAGVQRYISIKRDAINSRPLVNGQTYYFVVTAYSYNGDPAVDFHALESRAQVLPIVPQSPKPGVRVHSKAGQVIDLSTTATHVSGTSEVLPKITIVDPTALTGHLYQISFDTSGGGTFKWVFKDSTKGSVLATSDNIGSNISGDPNSDAQFPIVDGMFPQIKEETPALKKDQTQWVSSSSVWFVGNRFTADPAAAFDGGVTTGAQLPIYLSHQKTSFNPFNSYLVEIRFDAATPQKAYRLRRTGPGSSYLIQSTNPFVNVPFSVWDVSDPANPRQLTLAWRDQDNDGTWNPPVTGDDDGLEIVFIYNKTYDPTGTTQFTMPPNAIGDECTKGAKADVMYGLSLSVLPGHTISESMGKLEIVPVLHLTLKDRFLFSTQAPDTSLNRAQQEIDKINVFPNPYYGFNTAEIDRLQKYVTFTHLPQRATLRIFNMGGVLVRVLDKDDLSQFVRWNLRNDNNLPIASGIYIVYVDMPAPIGRTKTLKLAIVQEEQILRTY
ncbi:MAG: T9SS type A sorting domain-containing protein [Ignavibacteria bacterium]|nr:T9SS type A sorting domain-containing protein [Ignavibacteria bacterium]